MREPSLPLQKFEREKNVVEGPFMEELGEPRR